MDRYTQRILGACSHTVIVSSHPEEIPEWLGPARSSECTVVAIIESVPGHASAIVDRSPLRMKLGPLERGRSPLPMPETLLSSLLHLIDHHTIRP